MQLERGRWAFAVVVGAGLCSALPARAQTTLIRHESMTASQDGNKATVSATEYGLIPSQVGFDIGTGIGANVVLGAQATFGGASGSVSINGQDQGSDASATAIRLLGYVEAVFYP
jgi:hypothetical protein